MQSLAIETGDYATWATVGVSLVLVVISLVQNRRQRQESERQRQESERQQGIDREAAEASHRQAEAAERRAIAVEEALAVLVQRSAPEPGAATPEGVRWELEHRKGHSYALRNVGDVTAHHVRIDPANLPPVTRNVPEDASVPPQGAVSFLMAGTLGGPVPTEIWVSWGENGEPVAVRIPS